MKVNIPATYSSITLSQFVKVMTAKGSIEKVCAITKQSKKVVRSWPVETIEKVINLWDEVVGKKTIKHTPTFKSSLFGKRLGLIPDFTAMSLGEDIDARNYASTIWSGNSEKPNYHDLPKLMALLFRPVTFRIGDRYEIEPYNPDSVKHLHIIDDMTMDRVEGALLFFSTIASEQINILPQYLLDKAEKEMREARVMLAKMQAAAEED